jgi:oxygen-independent coproporphyrinogen-3 oxidase
LAQGFFPGAFSADLISGFPLQDEEVLFHDIEQLLSYRPAHVSLYALTVEEGTPLADFFSREKKDLSNEEAEKLWIAGRNFLEKAGYAQYEVSNFCLPGKECCHNIRYWRMENWLALGPAGSSTIIDDEKGTGRRFTAAADVDAWLGKAVPGTEEILDPETLMKEMFLMGFRYREGPDEALFVRRFGRTIQEAIPQTIAVWRKRGLFQEKNLTREGLLFLNRFLLDAFAELTP